MPCLACRLRTCTLHMHAHKRARGADKQPYAQRLNETAAGVTYTPASWIETKADCKEKAEVFVFVTEKFTITTANLVFFGVGKAVFNFVTGIVCDTFGRKTAIIIGWCCAIPMPFMVMYAENWYDDVMCAMMMWCVPLHLCM